MDRGAGIFTVLLRTFHAAGKAPLLTAAAYAAGAYLGFYLRFPPTTTSVLWPPNAILTISLLLTSPSVWWVHSAAVLPVHLLVELPVVRPPSMVPLLFVTNCCEALLAAAIVRCSATGRIGSTPLHRMLSFIVGAVVAAPLLSSFLDAAVVSTMTGQRYWTIWSTRFPANALTELTLVPPSVIALASGWRKIRLLPRRRVVEAVLLLSATALIGAAVFDDHIYRIWHMWGLWMVSLAVPLPIVLTAALRFGPAGASSSLLILGSILIWMGVHERGPFRNARSG